MMAPPATSRTTLSMSRAGPTLAATALALALAACATDTSTGNKAQASNACPSDIKGNECEYYQDGYTAGAEDGRMGMSMAYERHAGAYDSRFESPYRQGYETGWRQTRNR